MLDVQINKTDPLTSEIFSSLSYHVGSVDLITRTQDLVVASALLFETNEARQVLPGAIRDDVLHTLPEEPTLPDETIVDAEITNFPESGDDPINQFPSSLSLPRSAPFTESFVDVNLPGGIYLRKPLSWASLSKWQVLVYFLCVVNRRLMLIIQQNLKWMLRTVWEKVIDGCDCI
jgi:hypothetical protein